MYVYIATLVDDYACGKAPRLRQLGFCRKDHFQILEAAAARRGPNHSIVVSEVSGYWYFSFFFGFKLRDRREVVENMGEFPKTSLFSSGRTYIDVANSDSAGHFVGVGGWIGGW